ncbi:uncharacterized protein HMPREF1541_08101 [Cyphellophora europaea CBS 101466]|uniref:Amino acid transporter transmembrane domain-containing protein n=1 Tax=Cyphellophora europaea (strain CBS 101466) TaxID=1220924 RepID=W2RKU7_CYPE1|nr:uncharacterized protein HMPREF1541_08101 [Cyphellophora europaea CBS 101466]ETN37111.1 hypothetical protein HMPREF1541_08101 [Cyphellophora europaea CBS 101466]
MADTSKSKHQAAGNGGEISPVLSDDHASVEKGSTKEDNFEVFRDDGDVAFRTVGWIWATAIFLKIIFATGVLTIPTAMAALGSFPGAVNVLGWQAVNTYSGVLMGDFRNRHAGVHSVADMAQIVGGKILREIIGFLFIITWVIVAASGIVGASTALNALSEHALCTNYFTLIVALVMAGLAGIRKFEHIGWLTWAGFVTIYAAVLIVVIGVTQRDRPAAAPQSGPYELGYTVFGSPDFVAGINAATSIFCSGSGTSAFMPVISEMRNPKDYKKSLFVCMGIVTASYLTFSLVVYYYCGVWVASPSLGSAGGTIKKVAYGVGLLGLLVTASLYTHVAAKYLFVRILRNSKHLQSNTVVHWGTWLGCTLSLSAVAFVIAGGVPIFNYLLSLAGSVGFASITITLPAYCYVYDHKSFRTGTMMQQIKYWFHWFLISLGTFLTVAGTYGVVQAVIDAYANGAVGRAFDCADNSGTVV